jgi:hypothetical protein
MKQHKKAARRKVSKRARDRKPPANTFTSQPTVNEDELMNQVENIVKALVNASHGDFVADVPSDETQDWENDEDWLEHLIQSVELLARRLAALDAISPEDLRGSWKRIQEESPAYGDFPVERYLDQFLTSLRDKFRRSLFYARLERDAHRLRMVVREEVASLCAQSTIRTHDFIKIPLTLTEGEVVDLSEREQVETTDIFCRAIWWMMGGYYPEGCAVHFYLECPEGWFSAEVYGDREEAEHEAEKRRLSGEGDFGIREISEGGDWVVFVVLFSKERPNFIE